MIGIYPFYRPGDGNNLFFEYLSFIVGCRLAPFFSGRSAMLAGLEAFGLTRMDEILVPPYLGHCVLSAISRTTFPTMTPSERTKAILVFHQFGFPQRLGKIESVANDKKWVILNDCANTLFTKVNGNYLINWGDFTVVSFSKLYCCGLGGGLWTKRKDLFPILSERSQFDQKIAEELFDFYLSIQDGSFGTQSQLKIDMLYGCLPEVRSISSLAIKGLPKSLQEIEEDIERRKRIYSTAIDLFGENIPICDEDVVPFAIPISGANEVLSALSQKIQKEFNVYAPLLHFDFARNMLNPDYRLTIVVGCHSQWTEELTKSILYFIESELH
jgi:hypothetical protein